MSDVFVIGVELSSEVWLGPGQSGLQVPLLPDRGAEAVAAAHFGCARKVYNLALDLRSRPWFTRVETAVDHHEPTSGAVGVDAGIGNHIPSHVVDRGEDHQAEAFRP